MKRRLLFMVLSLLMLGSMWFFSVDSQARSNGQMRSTSTASPKPTPPVLPGERAVPVPVAHDPEARPERTELDSGGYRLVYRNSDGIVFREEEFGEFDVKIKATAILTIWKHNGKVAKKLTTYYRERPVQTALIEYDNDGDPLYRQISVVFPVDWTDIVRRRWKIIKREMWDLWNRKWIPDPRYEKTSQVVPGFSSTTQVAVGVQTSTFKTPQGEIKFNLPGDLVAGENVSGSIYVKPNGQTQKEQARNAKKLGQYVVELENQRVNSSSTTFQSFRWKVPGDAFDASFLVLRDKKGNQLVRSVISISPASNNAQTQYVVQQMIQQGENVEIRGKFDGNNSNTRVRIGGQSVPIVAESQRRLVVYNDCEQYGMTQIEIRDGQNTVKRDIRNIGIRLSAPNLNLTRGEQTILTVEVFGLSGIKNALPLVVTNESPQVVTMSGGDTQNIMIMPGQVSNGVFTIKRTLSGNRRGAFSINGRVSTGPKI